MRSSKPSDTSIGQPTAPSADQSTAGKAADGGEGGSEKKVIAAAVGLLSRREHSTEELKRKLLTKGHPAAAVDAAVEKLRGKKLVSDHRFASSFVHYRAQRGQGPVRIRSELRQQGIDDESIDKELENPNFDWAALASDVRVRKFGAAQPRTLAERAKQARFLQYRGFNNDQIRAALNAAAESGDSVAPAEDDGLDLDLDS